MPKLSNIFYVSLFYLYFFTSSVAFCEEDLKENISLQNIDKMEIIKQKMIFYNNIYPEIQFMQLKGNETWQDDIVTAVTLLGNQPDNLDFEHPPELNEALLNASITRLSVTMQSDIISAALFKVGTNSILVRPNLCIITLDPDTFIMEPLQATNQMLNLSEKELKSINKDRLLNPLAHFEFTIDHEVFHCIDSYVFGGAPMTLKKYGGERNLFRRESAADAFALAMHIRKQKERTSYANNITHVRALWLFTESPNRCSFESMLSVLETSVEKILSMTNFQLINYIVKVTKQHVGDYDFYVKQRAAAFKAAKALGLNSSLYGDVWKNIESVKVDDRQVDFRIKRYQYYYKQLFASDDEIKFIPSVP